jgi:hypothetical protein
MSIEPQKTAMPPPPKWLTRSEKLAFRRLVDARQSAGKPVSTTETDMIADLCTSRSRLADLRRLYRAAIREARESGSGGPDEKHALALARQIDAATGAAHRLARRLEIVESPKKQDGSHD